MKIKHLLFLLFLPIWGFSQSLETLPLEDLKNDLAKRSYSEKNFLEWKKKLFAPKLTINYMGEAVQTKWMHDFNHHQVETKGSHVLIKAQKASSVLYIRLKGDSKNGSLKIEAECDLYIEFEGLSLNNTQGDAIEIINSKNTYFLISENTSNRLSSFSNDSIQPGACIYSTGDLYFYGTGNLKVEGKGEARGIRSKDNILFYSGNFQISSENQDAIKANDGIYNAGANLDISAHKDGLDCKQGLIYLSQGNTHILHADDAVKSQHSILIDGGNLSVDSCYEGLEAIWIQIDGGNISIKALDDPINTSVGKDTEIPDSSMLVINNGNIVLNAIIGDGIDVNGNFIQNGGELLSYGADTVFDVGIDVNDKILFNGGRAIISSYQSNLIEQANVNSKQVSILFLTYQYKSVKEEAYLFDAQGNELMHYVPIKEYYGIQFSDPRLKIGEKYTLNIGDDYYLEFILESQSSFILFKNHP